MPHNEHRGNHAMYGGYRRFGEPLPAYNADEMDGGEYAHMNMRRIDAIKEKAHKKRRTMGFFFLT